MIARRIPVVRITFKRAAAGALILLATAFGAWAQSNRDLGSQGTAAGSASGMTSQPGGSSAPNAGTTHQGGDDATLEISPQVGIPPAHGGSDEIPSNREFRPGDDTASINRDFQPGELDQRPTRGGRLGNSTSCLGIQVRYTNYCFKGAEEHGLEVTSIDRSSPAERAGLKATGDQGGMIAAAETASALLGPVQILTNHFLEKAAMGDRGDLIVAVDDRRVRSQADFDDAMARARPGDTIYLTVVRPLPGGDHKTMKIAVNVGKWQPGTAESCTDATTASSQPASPY